MKIKIIVILLLTTMVLVSCSQKTNQVQPNDIDIQADETKASPEKKVEKEEPEKKEKEEPKYANYAPLTGVGTNDPIDNRIIGVMVNNHPKARPQTGLHMADIVYEVLAEGYITRFLALYHSNMPEKVGPVRSSRDYYIMLNKGYDALYVNYGQSPEAMIMLSKGVVDHVNGMGYVYNRPYGGFERASFRRAPHNAYITYDNIIKEAKRYKYNLKQDVPSLPFLQKEQLEALKGNPAKDIMITYSTAYDYNVSYSYNSDTKEYQRYSVGEMTIDRETKTPITVDNILIVEMKHKVIDNEGRREIDLNSGGKGYLIQRGQYKEITWKNVDGRILPFENGKQAGFVPGKTWINVIPTDPGLEAAVSFEQQ